MSSKTSNLPDQNGFYGKYGGKFVPETLMYALEQLEDTYKNLKDNKDFKKQFYKDLSEFVGRPSPLYFAERLTQHYGTGSIWLKREDLNHTGAHKINNTIGQILLAKHMGKKRIIAETGAGQHGVATATVAARLGLECHIYMGAEDVIRQSLNVYRIKLLGAQVHSVDSGSATLKDALNEALRDWVTNVDDTYYIIGSVTGPHPYPMIVRDFNSVVGEELIEQSKELFNAMPDAIVACVGGGSNAMGLFFPFLDDKDVKMFGVEAGGKGVNNKMEHAASLTGGRPGILHGNRTYLLQDSHGQIIEGHSISAGLDYPGIGPEHSYLHDMGRVQYVSITDKEALDAFKLCCEKEGIIPALEPSHALAYVKKIASKLPQDHIMVMNMCGRGDKDIFTVAESLGFDIKN